MLKDFKIKKALSVVSLLYKTNRVHVAVRLFSNRSQKKSVTHSAIASCATYLFLPHFDVICDLLLNRRTATWNLFVKYITLDSYTWLYITLHSYTWLYITLHSYTWLYMAIHNSTQVYMAIHNPTQVYMAIHNPTQLYMAIHNPTHVYTWLYMAVHNPKQVYMAIHGCT